MEAEWSQRTSDVKWGDLGRGQRRAPEESQSPYERRSAVMGVEQRGTGRWMGAGREWEKYTGSQCPVG